jgi:hypothetical protein
MSRSLAAVLTVAGLLASSSARAEATPEATRAEARERFDRGLRLFEEGDNAGALAEFKRAHDLVPNRLVLFNIGMVYAAMNRPVEATETLERVLAESGPLAPDRLELARRTRDEQARRIARLAVSTNIPAIIEVDGVEAGPTPRSEPLRVAGGTHVVGALAPGHLPSRREVTVAGGATLEITFDLVPTESRPAYLDIRSPLPGAEILIDGAVAGRTPLAASLAVAPGTRVVQLRRPGYRPERRQIALDEGAKGTLDVDLDEDPSASAERGWLNLASSESEVHITVDGRSRGVYRHRLDLPAGVHTLRIERPGFTPVDRDVLVPAKGEITVRATLQPTPETRLAYVSQARKRRRWSWVVSASGLGLAATAGALTTWAHTTLPAAERTRTEVRQAQVRKGGGACDPAQALTDAQIAACQTKLEDAEDAVSRRTTVRVAGLAGVGVGILAAGIGLYLLATGEDPEKYDRAGNDSLAARPVLSPVGWVSRAGGGIVLSGSF